MDECTPLFAFGWDRQSAIADASQMHCMCFTEGVKTIADQMLCVFLSGCANKLDVLYT